jgi:hypothetical protein
VSFFFEAASMKKKEGNDAQLTPGEGVDPSLCAEPVA